MKRAFLVAAFYVSLSGCQKQPEVYQPPSYSPSPPVRLSAADREVITSVVRSEMKDPWSVKFGPMSAVKDDSGLVFVCGTLNAKNSFGAYTGYQPFSGALSKIDPLPPFFSMIGRATSEAESQALIRQCRGKGVAI